MTRQAKLISSRKNTDGTFNATLEDIETRERYEIMNAHVVSIEDSQRQSFDGVPVNMQMSFAASAL